MQLDRRFDIVIIGAGLAGLSLCRQLLLKDTEKRILLIDNRPQVPGKKQKVGESLVQVGGYYFSKVLDLEEHLFNYHYLKYNLRFYWKSDGGSPDDFENYSQSYIRPFSNVCSYQLDRNVLEKYLLELNSVDPRVRFLGSTAGLKVELAEGSDHHVSFRVGDEEISVAAEWVVDTTGRGQFLKRKYDLAAESEIRHGASWCWVEGLVNIEKLTASSLDQIRKKPDRREQGLIPLWLSTNHFMGEGFWFWVIPLQGLTSLGLVYDKALFDESRVKTAEDLVSWACEEFPLFQEDLPRRKILDSARLLDYAYDCRQTISPQKWGMSGMSGRFTDPLYSPGSDLIALYNTMLVDAILSEDQESLERKAELYEPLMKVFYEAYVPSYSVSYDALGDQEVFTLKYAWELAIYFSFYVFPFMNDFFTESSFVQAFFRKFAQLGPINRNLQELLHSFYEWKGTNAASQPKVLNDFMELTPLKTAETAFYEFGLDPDGAEEVLQSHLENLKEFARFVYVYVASRVLDEPEVRTNRQFVESVRLRGMSFDPEEMKRSWLEARQTTEQYQWNLDPDAMRKFESACKRFQVAV